MKKGSAKRTSPSLRSKEKQLSEWGNSPFPESKTHVITIEELGNYLHESRIRVVCEPHKRDGGYNWKHFITGIGSIANIAGDYYSFPDYSSPHANRKAIELAWRKAGSYIDEAIRQVEKESAK